MPQSLSTWVLEGDSHAFTGFGDSAQGLTEWVNLKRGLFGSSLFSLGNLWQMPPVTGSYPQMKKIFTDAPQRFLPSFESVKSADKTLHKRLAVLFIHH